MDKKEFETEVETLRLELLEAQRALQKAGVPVILLLAGADGAGKGETVTAAAPWTLVPGNDKRFARIQVIETLCERLREALDAGR